ncbi:hypothetical protein [Streptomyces sp. NPDC048606]|uniref:hypothetical protein n=1 Tax=Streptomyces sp. NPDC048606 TaxID=3154726 RepID=UPI0034496535
MREVIEALSGGGRSFGQLRVAVICGANARRKLSSRSVGSSTWKKAYDFMLDDHESDICWDGFSGAGNPDNQESKIPEGALTCRFSA